jgi:hypothetical protein
MVFKIGLNFGGPVCRGMSGLLCAEYPFSKALLKNVEELTLYVIELNKKWKR